MQFSTLLFGIVVLTYSYLFFPSQSASPTHLNVRIHFNVPSLSTVFSFKDLQSFLPHIWLQIAAYCCICTPSYVYWPKIAYYVTGIKHHPRQLRRQRCSISYRGLLSRECVNELYIIFITKPYYDVEFSSNNIDFRQLKCDTHDNFFLFRPKDDSFKFKLSSDIDQQCQILR